MLSTVLYSAILHYLIPEFDHLYRKFDPIIYLLINLMTSLVAQMVMHLPTMWETWVQSLGWEDLLEKEMATHSRILAWKIPWMEEPGRLQSMGSQRVRHDQVTSLSVNDHPWKCHSVICPVVSTGKTKMGKKQILPSKTLQSSEENKLI